MKNSNLTYHTTNTSNLPLKSHLSRTRTESARMQQIRRQISAGIYLTDEKLDAAIERLLANLSGDGVGLVERRAAS